MKSKPSIRLLVIILPAIFSALQAQDPDALSIYQDRVYYLAKETRFFTGTYYRARNSQDNFTIARPVFVSLAIQRDFFQDSPEASREIELVKEAAHNQIIAASVWILSTYYAYMYPVLLYAEFGAIAWYGVEFNIAMNHLNRALHQYNLAVLQSSIPPEAHAYFARNCMQRRILIDGSSQVVVGDQPHDVARFLQPASATEKLFAISPSAARAYRDFDTNRRRSLTSYAASLGVFLGSMVMAGNAKTRVEFEGSLLFGIAGLLGFIIQGAQKATDADNSLNEAVYLYNEELLRRYP